MSEPGVLPKSVLLEMEPKLRLARDMVRALRVMAEHGERTGLDGEECLAMAAVAAVGINAADALNDALQAALRAGRPEPGDSP